MDRSQVIDVVLVNPGSRKAIYKELGNDFSANDVVTHLTQMNEIKLKRKLLGD